MDDTEQNYAEEAINKIDGFLDLISENSDPEMLEFVFLKIWIVYELFEARSFTEYALGNKQIKDGLETKKINRIFFADEEHLKKVAIDANASYIDFHTFIAKKSSLFLAPDPFASLRKTSEYSELDNAKFIRNYIAHESEESRSAFTRKITFDTQKDNVANYLQATEKSTQQSNMTKWVQLIKSAISYIDAPFFD